jgi:F-box protein 21
LTCPEKAALVASYLLSNHFTGIQPDKDYHNLEHNFIGIALLKDPHHSSLPLISAAIYCHVARAVGLNAMLCGFPFHVHVIVKSPVDSTIDNRSLPEGTEELRMYLDPFRSAEEVPLDDLKNHLRSLGASAIDQSNFLEAMSTSDVVLRSGRNVLHSVQQTLQTQSLHSSPVSVISAKYAGFWSLMLFERQVQPLQLREHLYWLLETLAKDFSPDIHLIERFALPLFEAFDEQQQIRDDLHRMRTMDEDPKRRQFRSLQPKTIKYSVGDIFRHRRYFYQAVIIGWDPHCEAGEQWIRQMGVDSLRNGRGQSFYHVL